MLKYVFFLSIFLFGLSFENSSAQCIVGPSTISENVSSIFSSGISAQAYYWSVSGGLSIIGSRTKKEVTIKCNGTGGDFVALIF